MASGGHVDRIAAEFGVHFIDHRRQPEGRHHSKARGTCKKLLRKHGPGHLHQVFGLINTTQNRGNWSSPCFTAVSWLILNKPELIRRADFLDHFDALDLDDLLLKAKRINPAAPTVTMTVLLSYELDRMIEKAGKEMAA